jgi:hypothetical protein
LSALAADDFELIRPHLRTVDLVAESNTLQQAKLIQYSRGHIEITNFEGLSKTACECYATVKAQYNRLLRPGGPS